MGLWNPPQSVQIDYTQIENLFLDQQYQTQRLVEGLTSDAAVKKTVQVTAVEGAVSSTSILEPLNNRLGASMRNTSTETVWIDVRNSFTKEECLANIEPGGYYELPCAYTREVWACSASGNGVLEIRDFIRNPQV